MMLSPGRTSMSTPNGSTRTTMSIPGVLQIALDEPVVVAVSGLHAVLPDGSERALPHAGLNQTHGREMLADCGVPLVVAPVWVPLMLNLGRFDAIRVTVQRHHVEDTGVRIHAVWPYPVDDLVAGRTGTDHVRVEEVVDVRQQIIVANVRVVDSTRSPDRAPHLIHE